MTFPAWWPYPGTTKKRRSSIARSVRADVYERDCYRCVECGSGERLTLDHRIPLSRGGTNAKSNLQTMCSSCNTAKGSEMPTDRGVTMRRGPHGEALT